MAVVLMVLPATWAQGRGGAEAVTVEVVQTDRKTEGDASSSSGSGCGVKFRLSIAGVTKVELESVDGLPLAGKAHLDKNGQSTQEVEGASTIVTYCAADESGFVPGKDYYISTLPCNLYGGYRLSFWRDGLVAHYFGVHQTVEPGQYISPDGLVDSDLDFCDPDAPLIEEARPKMDDTTHKLYRQYQRNPTAANKQALLDQMGLRYDKVVARKKNKLRELEREARTRRVVENMENIVDEMVQNREARIQQQFLRLVDPRRDEDPSDTWMVLRGAPAQNAYIAYAPVTNAEYAVFDSGFAYEKGKENHPAVNLSVDEAKAYCDWLSAHDQKHAYRLPSEEEWVLGAGHMPKDVKMNAGNVEHGLTAVDAYRQTTGACGGIDFWGNCWEWTSSTNAEGMNVVKGGSWDAKRDDCRSENSNHARSGAQGFDNVGFRVVRTDNPN